MESNIILIQSLKDKGVLCSENIADALSAVLREDFVIPEFRDETYADMALPIGGGQTISQPYTVVFMLELLKIQEGNRVLEAGYGSGWQTALISYLVGEKGRVYAFEIAEELCRFGKENFKKYPELSARAELYCRSSEFGFPSLAPFDRIIAAAEVKTVPEAWREQLAAGGRMIYPQGNALVLEEKQDNGAFTAESYHGFVFVPFIETGT